MKSPPRTPPFLRAFRARPATGRVRSLDEARSALRIPTSSDPDVLQSWGVPSDFQLIAFLVNDPDSPTLLAEFAVLRVLTRQGRPARRPDKNDGLPIYTRSATRSGSSTARSSRRHDRTRDRRPRCRPRFPRPAQPPWQRPPPRHHGGAPPPDQPPAPAQQQRRIPQRATATGSDLAAATMSDKQRDVLQTPQPQARPRHAQHQRGPPRRDRATLHRPLPTQPPPPSPARPRIRHQPQPSPRPRPQSPNSRLPHRRHTRPSGA